MNKSINSQIKTFLNKYDMIDLKIIHMDEKSIEFSTKGGAKPMTEGGFNQKQIQQIAEVVKNIVEPEFNKINNRLDILEQDVKEIKVRVSKIESCPTIQKELLLVQ